MMDIKLIAKLLVVKTQAKTRNGDASLFSRRGGIESVTRGGWYIRSLSVYEQLF